MSKEITLGPKQSENALILLQEYADGTVDCKLDTEVVSEDQLVDLTLSFTGADNIVIELSYSYFKAGDNIAFNGRPKHQHPGVVINGNDTITIAAGTVSKNEDIILTCLLDEDENTEETTSLSYIVHTEDPISVSTSDENIDVTLNTKCERYEIAYIGKDNLPVELTLALTEGSWASDGDPTIIIPEDNKVTVPLSLVSFGTSLVVTAYPKDASLESRTTSYLVSDPSLENIDVTFSDDKSTIDITVDDSIASKYYITFNDEKGKVKNIEVYMDGGFWTTTDFDYYVSGNVLSIPTTKVSTLPDENKVKVIGHDSADVVTASGIFKHGYGYPVVPVAFTRTEEYVEVNLPSEAVSVIIAYDENANDGFNDINYAAIKVIKDADEFIILDSFDRNNTGLNDTPVEPIEGTVYLNATKDKILINKELVAVPGILTSIVEYSTISFTYTDLSVVDLDVSYDDTEDKVIINLVEEISDTSVTTNILTYKDADDQYVEVHVDKTLDGWESDNPAVEVTGNVITIARSNISNDVTKGEITVKAMVMGDDDDEMAGYGEIDIHNLEDAVEPLQPSSLTKKGTEVYVNFSVGATNGILTYTNTEDVVVNINFVNNAGTWEMVADPDLVTNIRIEANVVKLPTGEVKEESTVIATANRGTALTNVESSMLYRHDLNDLIIVRMPEAIQVTIPQRTDSALVTYTSAVGNPITVDLTKSPAGVWSKISNSDQGAKLVDNVLTIALSTIQELSNLTAVATRASDGAEETAELLVPAVINFSIVNEEVTFDVDPIATSLELTFVDSEGLPVLITGVKDAGVWSLDNTNFTVDGDTIKVPLTYAREFDKDSGYSVTGYTVDGVAALKGMFIVPVAPALDPVKGTITFSAADDVNVTLPTDALNAKISYTLKTGGVKVASFTRAVVTDSWATTDTAFTISDIEDNMVSTYVKDLDPAATFVVKAWAVNEDKAISGNWVNTNTPVDPDPIDPGTTIEPVLKQEDTSVVLTMPSEAKTISIDYVDADGAVKTLVINSKDTEGNWVVDPLSGFSLLQGVLSVPKASLTEASVVTATVEYVAKDTWTASVTLTAATVPSTATLELTQDETSKVISVTSSELNYLHFKFNDKREDASIATNVTLVKENDTWVGNNGDVLTIDGLLITLDGKLLRDNSVMTVSGQVEEVQIDPTISKQLSISNPDNGGGGNPDPDPVDPVEIAVSIAEETDNVVITVPSTSFVVVSYISKATGLKTTRLVPVTAINSWSYKDNTDSNLVLGVNTITISKALLAIGTSVVSVEARHTADENEDAAGVARLELIIADVPDPIDVIDFTKYKVQPVFSTPNGLITLAEDELTNVIVKVTDIVDKDSLTASSEIALSYTNSAGVPSTAKFSYDTALSAFTNTGIGATIGAGNAEGVIIAGTAFKHNTSISATFTYGLSTDSVEITFLNPDADNGGGNPTPVPLQPDWFHGGAGWNPILVNNYTDEYVWVEDGVVPPPALSLDKDPNNIDKATQLFFWNPDTETIDIFTKDDGGNNGGGGNPTDPSNLVPAKSVFHKGNLTNIEVAKALKSVDGNDINFWMATTVVNNGGIIVYVPNGNVNYTGPSEVVVSDEKLVAIWDTTSGGIRFVAVPSDNGNPTDPDNGGGNGNPTDPDNGGGGNNGGGNGNPTDPITPPDLKPVDTKPIIVDVVEETKPVKLGDGVGLPPNAQTVDEDELNFLIIYRDAMLPGLPVDEPYAASATYALYLGFKNVLEIESEDYQAVRFNLLFEKCLHFIANDKTGVFAPSHFFRGYSASTFSNVEVQKGFQRLQSLLIATANPDERGKALALNRDLPKNSMSVGWSNQALLRVDGFYRG